ncbi:hypothetical protein SAMN05443270_0020 [Lacrimispora sphenoides]|uniref:hypothetical protein n=1 Tax=Lacrimispora sphenoides TaxID=29370 RepID=UPI0008D0C8E4|nr:hypothetical protein [Lacrimispora sphenoides]SET42994.1 hypothetical protein SAMN05443270_0020 [Lacrimispora sphenoides]
MIKVHRKKRIRLLNELEDLENKRKLFQRERYEDEESGENQIEDTSLQLRELERNIEDIVTYLHERL